MSEDRKNFCLEGEKERAKLDFTPNQMGDKISQKSSKTYPELDALYEEREKNTKIQKQLEESKKVVENNSIKIKNIEKELLDKTLKVEKLEKELFEKILKIEELKVELQNNFPSAIIKLAKLEEENKNLRNNNEKLKNNIYSKKMNKIKLIVKSFLAGLILGFISLFIIYFKKLYHLI